MRGSGSFLFFNTGIEKARKDLDAARIWSIRMNECFQVFRNEIKNEDRTNGLCVGGEVCLTSTQCYLSDVPSSDGIQDFGPSRNL